MVYKFFDRKSAGSGVNMHTNNRRPLDLDEELHCLCNGLLLENLKEEQFIQDLKTIFGVLIQPDMQLISKFNKGFRFLMCVIDIFSKYASISKNMYIDILDDIVNE